MAYDPATRQMVLFGGQADTSSDFITDLADTWLFDGHRWHQAHPRHSPPAREGGALGYDQATHDLVLFSGLSRADGSINLLDTWVWNGADWTQEHPLHTPSSYPVPVMAIDPAARHLVMFGPPPDYPGSTPTGFSSNGTGVLERWTWTGTDWSYQADEQGPPFTWPGGFVYDQLTRRMVYFSYQLPAIGCPAPRGPGPTPRNWCVPPDPTGTRFSTTWVWDGSRFTVQHPNRAPTSSNLVIADLAGGHASVLDQSGQLWTWTGTTWQPGRTGGPASAQAAAYDPAIRGIVVFGPYSNDQATNQTWTWDGRTWEQVDAINAPRRGPSTTPTSSSSTGHLTGTLDAVGGPAPGSSRPLNGTIYIGGPGVLQIIRQVPVGSDGRFSIDLPPGTYRLRGRSPLYDNGQADCLPQQPVAVESRAVATVEVDCSEQ